MSVELILKIDTFTLSHNKYNNTIFSHHILTEQKSNGNSVNVNLLVNN